MEFSVEAEFANINQSTSRLFRNLVHHNAVCAALISWSETNLPIKNCDQAL